MQKFNYISWTAIIGVVASLAITMPALAATNLQKGVGGPDGNGMRGGAPGIIGTVSAVSGTTFTVTTKATSTVYTVNAASATVYKDKATSTVSSIATGDTVMVQGTVTGTTVAATVIRDGIGGGNAGKPEDVKKGSGHSASSTPPISSIKGNGQPIIGGSVTVISGTTLTVTNASNVTYTIDASAATFVKDNTTSTISGLAVGDSVVVQGTVNGTSVTASSIIVDKGVNDKNKMASSTASSTEAGHGGGFGGFFSAIGGFFSHLFGF